MNPIVEGILALLLLVSSVFTVVGSVGLVRLSDFFKRLHAPTKATTLGVGSILLVSIFYHPLVVGEYRPRELLITLFLFITAPISAHMMAKAALALRIGQRPRGPNIAITEDCGPASKRQEASKSEST